MFWTKYFQIKDIPDLSGKVAIVTGSNTGIGKICAREMARKQCHVVLACRNPDKGLAAVDEIKKETGSDKIEFIKLDLGSLGSVKEFADEFQARHQSLHILLNNAGVMMCPFGLTKDGLETQFGTNHVGHYYLTMLLLPVLERSAPSRIVNVSSMAHLFTLISGINYDTLHDEKHYDRNLQYARSKAANILFTRELDKRLREKGSKVYVNCNHPGVVQSELARYVVKPKSLWSKIYDNTFCISTEDGALTQLYLATSPEVETKDIHGKYYVPYARPGSIAPFASSEKNALELWNYTENLLKSKAPGYEGVKL